MKLVNIQFPTDIPKERNKITLNLPTQEESELYRPVRRHIINVISHFRNKKPAEVYLGISENPILSYDWIYNIISQSVSFLKNNYPVNIFWENNKLSLEVKDNDEEVISFSSCFIGIETGNIYLSKEQNSIKFGNIKEFVSLFTKEEVDLNKLIQSIKNFIDTYDFSSLELKNFIINYQNLPITTPDSFYPKDLIPQDFPHLFIFNSLGDIVRYYSSFLKIVEYFNTSLSLYNAYKLAVDNGVISSIQSINLFIPQMCNPSLSYRGFRVIYNMERPKWVLLFKKGFIQSCLL